MLLQVFVSWTRAAKPTWRPPSTLCSAITKVQSARCCAGTKCTPAIPPRTSQVCEKLKPLLYCSGIKVDRCSSHLFFQLPGCFGDPRPVYVDSYSGSLSSSKKKDYLLSEHVDLCSSAVLMQLPTWSAAQGPPHQQSEPRPPAEEGDASRRPRDCLPLSSTFMGRCTSDFSQDLFLFLSFGLMSSSRFLFFFVLLQEHLGKLRGGLPTTCTRASALPTGSIPRRILTQPRTPIQTWTRAARWETPFTKGRSTAAGLSPGRSAGRALSFLRQEGNQNKHFLPHQRDTLAVKDLSRVNVKDNSTLRTSPPAQLLPITMRHPFQNIDDYIHFFNKDYYIL